MVEERIRLRREKLIEAIRTSKRSQNGWALRIGISNGYLSRLVNGKRRYPGLEIREKLLAALNLPFEELFEVESEALKPKASTVSLGFHHSPSLLETDWEKRTPMLDTLWKDLHFGLRMLLRKPGFAIAAVLALGLGVGATTAIFSVLHAVVLNPLPYPDPDRLVMLWARNRTDGIERTQLSPVNFMDYRELDDVFVDATAWWYPEINLTDEQDEPIRVNTIEVAGNFVQVMRVTPVLGSGFPEEEGLFAGDEKVLISHRLWQSRYQGSETVLGMTVHLNGRPNVITGVMPPGFHFPGETDVWQRLNWDLRQHSRGAHFMEAVGRLKPGVTLEVAAQQLEPVGVHLEREFSNSNRDWRVFAIGLQDEIVGDFSQSVTVLFVAVFLLLLLACANVANLLLARSTSRDREVAVRAAIGASRIRLFRQFLTESLLLGVTGSLVGLGVAFVSLRILRSTAVDIPRIEGVQIDGTVLLFCLATGLLTTLIFGMLPALQTAGADLQRTLIEGGRGGASGHRGLARNLLVVVEVALAVVLLAGAGLLIRSFAELIQEDAGFEPSRVASLNIQLPAASYRDYQRVSSFYTELLERLKTQSGIESVGASGFLPFEPGWRIPFIIKGKPPVEAGEEPHAQYITITPGYLESLSVPLLRGRMLEFGDDSESVPVVVINQAMAERIWAPGEDPIDDIFVARANGIGPLGRTMVDGYEYRIVGVVGNIKNTSLTEAAEPAVFFSHQQFGYRSMNLVMRGTATSAQMIGAARQELKRLDPGLAISSVRSLDELFESTVARPRFVTLLMAGFAAVALTLAAVGIYGVLSYAVGERRQEIGIRMALGASPRNVLQLVVVEAFRWTLLGLALGMMGALLVGRLLSSLLYGVSGTDFIALGGVVLVTVTVSFLACYQPARKASLFDPLLALRSD